MHNCPYLYCTDLALMFCYLFHVWDKYLNFLKVNPKFIKSSINFEHLSLMSITNFIGVDNGKNIVSEFY